MKRQLSRAFFFFFCLCVLAWPSRSAGQQPSNQSSTPKQQSTQAASQKDKEDVVRISVTLVQVDAVVIDKKGRYVTNLKPDDFEISEDGKRQSITNFSYVETQPATPQSNRSEPGMPPVPLRPESVRRTIALVVDDLGLSFESVAYVRSALKKYVSEQMQPGDLVAIIRTSAGIGALQQFTNDRRVLNAAIERIRWNAFGRSGVTSFAPVGGSQGRSIISGSEDTDPQKETLEQFREELFTVGTLGGVNFVIRAMRELPGRKSVLLFSDGFRLFSDTRGDLSNRVFQAVRRLTDLANRASVVIYTMDARGLQTAGLNAADRTNTMGNTLSRGGMIPEVRTSMEPEEIRNQERMRHQELFNTQDGLHYLADQTGGFFIRNTNDLNSGIRRVLDDQRGYYLLGYVPEASSFRAKSSGVPFHKISVKVKDSSLQVRSRTGFYGVSDEMLRPKAQAPVQQLLAALTSPVASGEIRLKLTSLFGHDRKAGAFVRSMLHIDPSGITFTNEPDGQHKGVIDIAAFTFGDSGEVIDHESREYTFRVPDAEFNQFMQHGLLYNVTVPIKKPGAYQLRVAVRDVASAKTGSANQFIEVPDVAKKRLALSGLVVGGSDPARQTRKRPVEVVNATEGKADDSDVESGPSVRVLRGGMHLNYGLAVYNATVTAASGRPQLEVQVRVLRDGKVIYTSQPTAVDLTGQTDWKQVVAGGKLQFGTQLEPGEYVLQVIITDRLAKEKYNSATQWIDFEIVK
ncbi:MAG: VWA domain-containing protein [Blastocatellia bacterium]